MAVLLYIASYFYDHSYKVWRVRIPAHGQVYSIQHYVIKFISDLQPVQWFSPGTQVSSTNKTDCHDIIEILLKVVLNTLTLTLKFQLKLSNVSSRISMISL